MFFTETCPRLSVGYGGQDGQCMRCSTTCLEFFTRVKDSRMNITSGLIGQNGHMILLECKQCASIFFGLIFLFRWESDYFHGAMHKRFLKVKKFSMLSVSDKKAEQNPPLGMGMSISQCLLLMAKYQRHLSTFFTLPEKTIPGFSFGYLRAM